MTEYNWKRRAQQLGYPDERSMWEDLYVAQGSSIDSLADRIGIGTHTVKRRLVANLIELRGRGGNNNATPPAKSVLWHLDQRVVHGSTIKELVWLTGCSPAVISGYKTLATEGE